MTIELGKKFISNNFGFLWKGKDQNTYEQIYIAEKNIRIDVKVSNAYRMALESFTDFVLDHQNLYDEYDDYLYDLSVRDPRHCEDNLFNRLKFLKNEKGILCSLKNVTCSVYDQTGSVNKDAYWFMREFGNSISHKENIPGKPKKEYGNALLALSCFHMMARQYYISYGLAGKNEIVAFDENLLNIGDFHVISYGVPADREMTRCRKEYEAYHLSPEGVSDYYSLVHEYSRKDFADQKSYNIYFQRELMVYDTTEMQQVDEVNRIPRVEIIYSGEGSGIDKCYVAYNFKIRGELFDIDDRFLKDADYRERLNICRRVLKYFDFLHSGENKIFHRMFNYRCIKVGKKGDSFIPYVTGFNFAKVEDQSNPVATVIAYASNARDKGKADQKSAKYIPGEWEYASEIGTEMDWEKVDVYSLGVFLCDMLSGRIHDHLLSEQEMKGLIPDPLISLILRMVSEDIYERPSCRDALQEMEQCQ